MAYVAGHLSVAALEERYEACEDAISSRRFQTIWLLAKGHSTGEAAAMTSFGQRWIEQLVGALQRARAFGVGRSASRQRRVGEGSEARAVGASARAFGRTAARRRGLDERQGRALDGW